MAEVFMQTGGHERVSAGGRTSRIAVLVPCYNEAATIATVVTGFKATLPDAAIYVYDNNSSDRTAEQALAAGAVVRRERAQGKGNVVRRMFADVDADVYVMVDGDATYDLTAAPGAIAELVGERLDFVNIARRTELRGAYRPGHRLGNLVLTGLVRAFFGKQFTDMLSGYKVFSRRFVKSFPALSTGFEIETELTIHALELAMPVSEREAPYGERPTGSTSKLHTLRDGVRILRVIGRLLKDERPLHVFFAAGVALIALAVLLALPIIETYLATGLVPRIPTAMLSVGLVLVGVQSFTAGLILDTVTRSRREMKRLAYLQQPTFD